MIRILRKKSYEYLFQIILKTTYLPTFAHAKFKRGAKGNFDLAKWGLVAHVPSFKEYMEVGKEEIVICPSMAAIFLPMEKIGTKEAYEWLKSRPNLVQSLCIITRLRNDIAGYEVQIRK